MKSITLHQPWGWLIAHADKRVENRGWSLPARALGEPLAIHQGASCQRRVWEDAAAFGIEIPELAQQPRMAVIAVATPIACVRIDAVALSYEIAYCARGVDPARVDRLCLMREGIYLAGPVGWVLDDVLALDTPVPCPGAQGLWQLPIDVEARVRAQIARAA